MGLFWLIKGPGDLFFIVRDRIIFLINGPGDLYFILRLGDNVFIQGTLYE
jgi:hypothetical protein